MRVTLDWKDCERDRLPDCCISCGGVPDVRVWRTFRWHPGWIWLFLFLGLLPLLIVVLLTQKSMRVCVPLCNNHVHQWRNRDIFAWISVLGCIALFIVGMVIASNGRGDEQNVGFILGAIGGFGLLASLVVVVVWNYRTVRPVEITRDEITFTSVHPDFADAVEEQWRERRRKSRLRREAEYDDYDEPEPRRPRSRYDDEEPRRRRDRDDDRYDDDDDRPRRR